MQNCDRLFAPVVPRVRAAVLSPTRFARFSPHREVPSHEFRALREGGGTVAASSPTTNMPTTARGPTGWVRTFNARYDWMGVAIAALSAWYFLATVVVAWVFNPAQGKTREGPEYSLVKNTISDLGNTACGAYGGSRVCSPRYIVMDATFALLGIAMIIGSFLIYSEFSKKALRREQIGAKIGFACIALGGFGSILVGSFPENTNGTMHATGAGLAIGGGELGILVLGFALVTIPEGLRHFMIYGSAVGIVAALSFALKHHFGLGAGGMERIAQYPESIWLISFGLYVTRDHYSRGLLLRGLRKR